MSWQLADALIIPCKCYSSHILVQFMCDHVCSCNTCTGRSHVAPSTRYSSCVFMYVHVTHALGGAMSRLVQFMCDHVCSCTVTHCTGRSHVAPSTRYSSCVIMYVYVTHVLGGAMSRLVQFMCVHVTHALGGAMSRAISTGRALICRCPELATGINQIDWLFSRMRASRLEVPGFDSRPRHVRPGTSSLGWRWP